MQAIQVIIIIFDLFALSRAVLRFKDNKLTKNEFMFWILIWGAVIVISIIPSVISPISNIFGIARGMDLIVYLSIIILFYLIFRLYVKLESVEKEITLVVRRIALKNKPKKKR